MTTSVKKQLPPGVSSLFFIQMISIISFSVLYSSLILYTTKQLKLNDIQSSQITGSFLALNYFLHLVSGMIGGRLLSFRSLFVISMCLQVIGCVLLSVPSLTFLLWGLAPFLMGCGLNISCINCLLTQFFTPDDKRRESAFLWNYAGQNIGFFIGFMMAGYFDLKNAYQELFLISAIGNILAIVITTLNWGILRDLNTVYSNFKSEQKNKNRFYAGILILSLTFLVYFLLQHSDWCANLIIIVTVGVFFYILAQIKILQNQQEKNNVIVYSVLAVAAIICWTLILVGPIGLNLFIERNVNLTILGIKIAPQWVQNVNTLVIILASPMLSKIFATLRTKGFRISIPFQFTLGCFFIGVSYLVLPIGIALANGNGFSSVNWVVLSFVLQSIGDLFISPVGYAMVGQLAPARLRGLMMGSWLMFGGITGIFADYFSRLAIGNSHSVNPIITNLNYTRIFSTLGILAIISGLILVVIQRWLDDLIGEQTATLHDEISLNTQINES